MSIENESFAEVPAPESEPKLPETPVTSENTPTLNFTAEGNVSEQSPRLSSGLALEDLEWKDNPPPHKEQKENYFSGKDSSTQGTRETTTYEPLAPTGLSLEEVQWPENPPRQTETPFQPREATTNTPENTSPFSQPPKEKPLKVKTPEQKSQERLQYQFEKAAQLGRDFTAELREREGLLLAPYLNRRGFNPEDMKVLRNSRVTSPEDIARVERASLAISLQAAYQIFKAELPRQRPEQALNRNVLGYESDSLGKMDRLLEKGFRETQRMLREGRASEVLQEARKVIAFSRRTTPDKIKTNDKQILTWIQETIHGAGRRIRKHRNQAQDLLRGKR